MDVSVAGRYFMRERLVGKHRFEIKMTISRIGGGILPAVICNPKLSSAGVNPRSAGITQKIFSPAKTLRRHLPDGVLTAFSLRSLWRLATMAHIPQRSACCAPGCVFLLCGSLRLCER